MILVTKEKLYSLFYYIRIMSPLEFVKIYMKKNVFLASFSLLVYIFDG